MPTFGQNENVSAETSLSVNHYYYYPTTFQLSKGCSIPYVQVRSFADFTLDATFGSKLRVGRIALNSSDET